MFVPTSTLLSQYLKDTKDSSADNTQVGKDKIGYYYLQLLAEADNYTLEKTVYGNAKDNQRSYLLRPDYIHMKTVRFKMADHWYPLTECPNLDEWHERTAYASYVSIPSHYIVINEQGNMHIELDGIPDADGTNNIELIYEGYQDPLYFPTDYETGTVTIAQGAAGVTGASTVWTSAMAGRFFHPTNSKYYYDIKAVGSNTSLTLVNTFQEDDITGGTYEIVECPRLPAEFQYSPMWMAIADYWVNKDKSKSQMYEARYARDLVLLRQKYRKKTAGRVIPGRSVNGSSWPVPRNYPKAAIG